MSGEVVKTKVSFSAEGVVDSERYLRRAEDCVTVSQWQAQPEPVSRR